MASNNTLPLFPLSAGRGAPVSPSTPTTTSTSKPSPSPHPATTSTTLCTWPRLTALLILTPPALHLPEQSWGGLLQTVSAPPAAPTRGAATGRSSSSSSSGRTSTCSLWACQRAARVRRSNECEWTAGWHRPCSLMATRHQGKHRKDTVMQMKCRFYWRVLLFFIKLSLFSFDDHIFEKDDIINLSEFSDQLILLWNLHRHTLTPSFELCMSESVGPIAVQSVIFYPVGCITIASSVSLFMFWGGKHWSASGCLPLGVTQFISDLLRVWDIESSMKAILRPHRHPCNFSSHKHLFISAKAVCCFF